MTVDRTRLTIRVPVFNEEATLPELIRRLQSVTPKLGFQQTQILFVDDGSADRTNELLHQAAAGDPQIELLFHSRNFGHQAAVSTGMEHATGTVIAIIDGDLQDSPEVIASFVVALENGADVAFGVRRNRKEGLLKRACYSAFYRILQQASDIDIPLDSGDFCCLTREVLDAILEFPERRRFIRGIRAWVGFKQVGIPYERDARFAGTSKYTVRKLVQLAFDGMFSFSRLPIRIMQFAGLGVTLAAVGIGLFHVACFLADRSTFPSGLATLTVSIWFLGGVQLLFLGIVGEYVSRTFDETRRRPISIVRKRSASADRLDSIPFPRQQRAA